MITCCISLGVVLSLRNLKASILNWHNGMQAILHYAVDLPHHTLLVQQLLTFPSCIMKRWISPRGKAVTSFQNLIWQMTSFSNLSTQAYVGVTPLVEWIFLKWFSPYFYQFHMKLWQSSQFSELVFVCLCTIWSNKTQISFNGS